MWGSSVSIPKDTVPYFPAINPAFFPTLWIILVSLGIFFMGWFFVYEVSVHKNKRSIMKEASLSITSSVLLGFGVLFLMLWSGVWV